ncbi:hypothetical protein [Streptomyces wuyuanensis]|uniref:hypothetical protein n=1 Tax=Streptomyces wuyuanensis TaxID=1196353 RepID=UPI003436C49A
MRELGAVFEDIGNTSRGFHDPYAGARVLVQVAVRAYQEARKVERVRAYVQAG